MIQNGNSGSPNGGWMQGRPVPAQYRFLLLATAWLAYMATTLVGYPFFGISVMLPSILLCALATWLYNCKTGLLVLFLFQPYNTLVLIFHTGDLQGWRAAIEPGGIATQLLAVLFVAMVKRNRIKTLELTATLEKRSRKGSRELQIISEYMATYSEAERSMMSEKLFDIVAYQLTGLLYHGETLLNFLKYTNASQTAAAAKLVKIGQQNIEQLMDLQEKLSSRKIMEEGIEQAFREMGAYFVETAGTRFSLAITDRQREIPDKIAISLYRIAHEAVTNALRHGKATQIDLALELGNSTCALIVDNNGNPLPENPREGIGMKLIRQRAEDIGATTTLGSSPEKKTRFKCVAPLCGRTV